MKYQFHNLNTLLIALLMALLFAACQQDTLATDALGNTLNPDGTVTITHLNVDIDGAQGTTAEGAAQRAGDVFTRTATGAAQGTAGTRADALPSAEEDAKVKTRFNTGEVLHIAVALTEADGMSGTYQLSTATLGADGRWALSPAIRLPQHAPDAFDIEIFYDGKTTAYNKYIIDPAASDYYDDNNFAKAFAEADCHVNNGTTPWPDHAAYKAAARTDANGNAYFRDVLRCLGGTYWSGSDQTTDGSIAIGASGTLGVKMVHKNALVRITAIANQLGSPVARAELITTTRVAPDDSPYTTFTLRGTGEATATTPAPATASAPTPGTLPWQALIGTGNDIYAPHSIRLTLADGRQFAVALPLPTDGTTAAAGGFVAKPNRVYAYRLTLLPGSLTATPDTAPGSLAWDAKPDPAVPAGYTRACTVAGGTYAGGLLGGNDLNYPSILYGCYAATPALSTGSTTKALGALVGINFGAYGSSSPDRSTVNLIASCYATPGATPAPGAGSTPGVPLKLVGINGTDNGTSSISNADGNARIIACLSPLAIAAQEERNRTDAATTRSNAPRSNATTRAAGSNGGVPIVSITPRGTAQGYLPLLQDPALAQLATLTALGFSGSSTDATTLVLTMPRVMVNTTTQDITLTEPGKGEVTIPPGGIYRVNHPWSLHTHIWSTLKDDNNKGMAPMIGWQ